MSLEIQRHITTIYDELDRYQCKDLREIHDWATRNGLKANDEFHMSFMHMERLIKVVTKHLNQLSESIDDLEIHVNRCKHLVLLEKEKDAKFAEVYNRYHTTEKFR